ncbi:SNF2 helicase associated domain-containing protein [Metallumcola ferriviriculae]|uniref:SNF2 helicase associated domain-containing protein n=1 Tax=Metallumcola ferriviriculae TaxID=3039180 RepID=A0AAU0ULI6_9FIRM|nr:SNF2 helicase associated domain-containing protein [Desulfitibacteraceae bacterium MK1]
MFFLTDAMIRKAAGTDDVYKRGLQYFSQGRVEEFGFFSEDISASAIVMGSRGYEVDVEFFGSGEILDMYCNCLAFSQYDGACKHIVAVLAACQWHHKNIKPHGTKPRAAARNGATAEAILGYFGQYVNEPQKTPLNIEVKFELDYVNRYFSQEVYHALSLRMGEEKLYVVKSVKKLFEAMDKGQELEFGKNFIFDPAVHVFRPEDEPLIDVLRDMYEVESSIFRDIDRYSSYYNSKSKLFDGKRVHLPQVVLKKVLSLMGQKRFNATLFNNEYTDLTIVEQDLPLDFKVDSEGKALILGWERLNMIPMIPTGEYLYFDGKVHKISEHQRKNFIPLVNALVESPDGIHFTYNQRDRFASEILPAIQKIGRVEITTAVQESLYAVDLITEIHLDRVDDTVKAEVRFIYGDVRINPFTHQTDYRKEDRILVRDSERETTILGLLEGAEFRTVNGSIYIEDEDNIFAFVHDFLPEIQELADVYYSESFRSMKIRNTASFSGGLRLNEQSDMLEISFKFDEINLAEIKNVLKSLQEKKRYYRLKDGSFLPLDTAGEEMQQVINILDSLDISDRELKKSTMELPKNRAMYLDRRLQELNMQQVEKNPAFTQFVRQINQPQDADFDVPDSLKGVLRDYQTKGFKWLKTLAMYGLGGILADDMGLGKTLQTLAFLLTEKEKVQAPSLVVAPTSVIYNWQEETRRFAPDLKVIVIAGTPRERAAQLKEAVECDLIITSYALIRRDIERYREMSFGYCILDEAQHIKNPNSQNAKSVKTVKARAYFALTGTPVENSLVELWSIFDFIMKGHLFSRQKFRKKYELPIMKNQDKNALNELQKQIAPFIMRRMKKDVLKELPPKFESKMVTELTGEQKKIYLAYLNEAKGEIEREIATRGFNKSQIKILTLLTRLRQICCHPGMFLENYRGDSGKLQYLKEILQDAIQGGHRILLFSQFTSMLHIIKKLLDDEGIEYFYLDGSIKAQKRTEMVKDFNNGQGETFLISLKAGGTGLNLTGADMVIHYDPWWNPAVEDQAADRAYRIGQKNSVQVIKLITKGTIEEKIFELQLKKKAMIESVIKPGETMLTKMTEQEVKELFDVV